MSNRPADKTASSHPLVYQIKLEGHLGQEWMDWFDGLSIQQEEDGGTLLTGPVIDQAALHGVIKKVRDLGLPLVSIRPVRPAETQPYDSSRGEAMNTIHMTTAIDVRIKLSAVWVSLMLLYIYADIFSFHRPGVIEAMISGRIGPFPVTQGTLSGFSILMMLPAVMVFLSLVLKPTVNRWVNIILGVLYTLVNVSNLIGETWAFYIGFGLVEIVLTFLIVGYAWKWRSPEYQPA